MDDLIDADLFFADLLLGRIQLHARRKELLDRKIMQIAANSISFVKEGSNVFSMAGRGELQCKRSLSGQ